MSNRATLLPLVLLVLLATTAAGVAEEPGDAAADPPATEPIPPGPSFKDVLSLTSLRAAKIAPDGSAVAYTVQTTDWEENRYDTEVFLAREGETPLQLTRTRDGSSSGARFSPDSGWIGFLADRGDGDQLHLIRVSGGEALQLTNFEEGVSDFQFSPGGDRIALAVAEPLAEDKEKRGELYGEFAIEDDEFRMSHLWLLDVAAAIATTGGVELPDESTDEDGEADESEEQAEEPSAVRRLTSGDDFTVDEFTFSPDGDEIAFSHRPNSSVTSWADSDISVVSVSDGEVRPLVARPAYDGEPLYSPRGEWILFATANEKKTYFTNSELAMVPASGGDIELLTADFDEDPTAVAWLEDGIRFLAYQKTHRPMFRLDPTSRAIEPVMTTPRIIWSADISDDGSKMALDATADGEMNEIFLAWSEPADLKRITDRQSLVAEWPLGSREVVEWESRDGARVEGILWKGEDFDSSKPHPLLVVIHGGPTGVSVPSLTATYVYPLQQWIAKGAVVLLPNYRGSAGYGEAFRSLNVRNLGVGDAWDVLSGVDHLIERGIADPDRMAAMGWSQGGYISAFLTTTTDRFRAISVGAGISDWMTYYVNTDIHPFTRHYLGSNPWDDPEIYAKTSPISYIKQAKTPTLIQHGENDARVPVPNAYELYQGLEDMGVETRLVIYRGFGHGITKPKERLAAVWHNWQWFARHLWDEQVQLPLDDD